MCFYFGSCLGFLVWDGTISFFSISCSVFVLDCFGWGGVWGALPHFTLPCHVLFCWFLTFFFVVLEGFRVRWGPLGRISPNPSLFVCVTATSGFYPLTFAEVSWHLWNLFGHITSPNPSSLIDVFLCFMIVYCLFFLGVPSCPKWPLFAWKRATSWTSCGQFGHLGFVFFLHCSVLVPVVLPKVFCL